MSIRTDGLEFLSPCCPKCGSVFSLDRFTPGKAAICPECSANIQIPAIKKLIKIYIAQTVGELSTDDEERRRTLAVVAARSITAGMRRGGVAKELQVAGLAQIEVEQVLDDSCPLVRTFAREAGRRMIRHGVMMLLAAGGAWLVLVVLYLWNPNKPVGGSIAIAGIMSLGAGIILVVAGWIKAGIVANRSRPKDATQR